MRVEIDARSDTAASPSSFTPFVQFDESLNVVSGHLESLRLSPRCRTRLRPTWTRYTRPQGWLEGMPRVGFVYDEIMLTHKQPGHLERPGRTIVPYERLKREGTLPRCFRLESRPALTAELLLFHTAQHVANIKSGEVDEDADVYWCETSTLESAVFSAGCTLQAVDAVMHGALDNAFALVRPPGHHADASHCCGFCFFNNVAIAASKALTETSLCQRVVIVDWDAHHGNGTQNGFYDNPNVLYISLHRGGDFYPGTGTVTEIGEGDGYGFNVNIPWPRGGFGDADYLAAFECIVQPLIAAFQSDIILVSAGFDAVMHDPLGGLSVTPNGFAHMTDRLLKLNSKTVLVLEGGYNILQVSACVDQCMRVLLGDKPKPLATNWKMQPETENILRAISNNLSLVTPCLSDTSVCRQKLCCCLRSGRLLRQRTLRIVWNVTKTRCLSFDSIPSSHRSTNRLRAETREPLMRPNLCVDGRFGYRNLSLPSTDFIPFDPSIKAFMR